MGAHCMLDWRVYIHPFNKYLNPDTAKSSRGKIYVKIDIPMCDHFQGDSLRLQEPNQTSNLQSYQILWSRGEM
jgi:hypothetical protein